MLAELSRPENTGWSTVCVDLLTEARADYPDLSWADVVAVSGAAAVEKCGGPIDSDRALLDYAELRPYVELYARAEAAFVRDFLDAYRRLTWLGAA